MNDRSVEASGAIEALAAREWVRHGKGVPATIAARHIRKFGTSADLDAMIEALEAAGPAAEMADSIAGWLGEAAETVDAVAGALATLRAARELAAETEAELAELGLRWNPKRGRLARTRAPSESGGTPGHYINTAIREAWQHLRPIYQADTGDDTWSAPTLREWIAEALRYLPEDLDAGAGGPIDRAIGNMRNTQNRR